MIVKKKVFRIVSCLVLFSLFFVFFDYNRIKKLEESSFTYKTKSSEYIYYWGLFYYFKVDLSDSPSKPLEETQDMYMGLWLLPSVQIND